jgi:hypothetical protein
MEKHELLKAFEQTIEDLIAHISSFSETELNSVPFEGSWTAGQVARHLLRSYSGAPQFLQGPVKRTERYPAQFVEPLRESFANLSDTNKFKSPDFIIPEEKLYTNEELLEPIRNVCRQIVSVTGPLDLTETCTAFALPVIGEMTRLEWINFMIIHTQRHIHQLNNIRRALE